MATLTWPSTLGDLSDYMAAKFGMGFPPERWRDLERALQPAVDEGRFGSLNGFAEWLLSGRATPRELEAVAARLTIGETYFFREPRAFGALREHIIPELIAAHRGAPRQFHVWSAGCCTGEEAYSLAIFLHRDCPELKGSRISIVATDINPHYLRKAREGIYRSWSFRGAPAWLQAEYFRPLGGDRFELRLDIRRMVEFKPLNLAEDSYPSLHNLTDGFDLIFCRNVLMYFSSTHAQRTVARFHRALVEGGHLVVSVCEVSSTLAPQYRSRAFPGVTLYQKQEPLTRHATADHGSALPPPSFFPAQPGFETPVAASPLLTAETASPPPVASTAMEDALKLFHDGDYGATIKSVRGALAQGAFDVDLATLLARAHANQGNLVEARCWIDRALVIDRLRAPLHHLRGSVLHEQGELMLAAEAFEKALYLDPDFVLAHVALADLADRAGRTEKAGRHLALALRCLRGHPPEAVVPEAEGLTARRLIATIEAMQASEAAT
jgi:chemotaxis protein methyltransferase CheR